MYDGIVTTNGAYSRREWVGCTQYIYQHGSVHQAPYDRTSRFFVPRPVLTAERPSQTMAQMGPLSISGNGYYSRICKYSILLNPKRTSDEALVERLVRQILVVLLEMLLRGRDQLHRCELVPVIAFKIQP